MSASPPFVTITRDFSFDAAHCLPNHEGGAGKCARPHGHSYTGSVSIYGPMQTEGDEAGMVVDFGRLSAVTDALDHRDLNVVLKSIGATTAENIATYLCETFYDIAQAAAERAGVGEKERLGLGVVDVELRETVRSCATVSRP